MATTPNRYAIRDAGDFTFYDISTGKAIVTLDTIKTAGMEFSGETVYARGGYGNPKLVGFSSSREGRLTLQDALFSNEAIGLLTGNKVVEGKKVVAYKEVVTIENNEAELKYMPKGEITNVHLVNVDGTNGKEVTAGASGSLSADEYSISGQVMTFDVSVEGDVRVYYDIETGEEAKTTTITSTGYAGTYKVVGHVLVRDSFDGKDYPATITIPRGKLEDNFTVDLSVDGEPAVLDLPVEMLKDPKTDEMWTMTVHNEK